MAHNVYYWQGCVNQDEFEDYALEISKLLSGEAPIEKLKNYNIYSARFSIKGRILFTFLTVKDKQCLLLLEILPNHEYDSARFLKKNVLKNYLEKNIERLTDNAVFEPVENETLPNFKSSDPIKYVNAHYYNKQFIALDDKQQQALSMPTPSMISGPAGSGKSCILFGVLQKLVEQYPLDETRDIVYVAESPELVLHMQKIWNESESTNLNAQRVKFFSYDTLLNEASDVSLSHFIKVGADDFYKWFEHYKHHDKTKNCANLGNDSSAVYQELRVISAYAKKNGNIFRSDYLNSVGKKQSIFPEYKALLIVIYEDYLKFISQKGLLDPAFYELNVHDKYYGIVVDEALDLSVGQWTTLLDLAQNHNIYYASDSHQMVNDRKSHRPLLLSLLRTITKRNVSHVELNGSYRCPNAVIKLVNAVIATKNELMHGVADQFELSEIAFLDEVEKEEPIHWYEPSTDIKSEDYKLQQKKFSPEWAVITLGKYKSEAQIRYGTPLVFTPLEAKGLGYCNVIAYNLLDPSDENIQEANTLLGPLPEVTPKYIHPSKSNQGNRRFAPAFNDLIIAFTRTMETLYVIQNRAHKVRHIIERLHQSEMSTPLSLSEDLDTYVAEDNTPEKWFEHAVSLLGHGNEVQAEDILRQKCGMTVEQVNETKSQYLADKKIINEIKPNNRSDLLLKMKQLYKNCTSKNLITCYQLQDDISWLREQTPNGTQSYLEWLFLDTNRANEFYLSMHRFKKGSQLNTFVRTLNLVHLAAAMNNITFLSCLKNVGTNLNERDAEGRTPLYFAIKNGHIETVRMLYNEGVDIDDPEQLHMPIHLAVAFNQYKIVCQLIELGVPKTIDCCNFASQTPLMIANDLKLSSIIFILTQAILPLTKINENLPPLSLPPAVVGSHSPINKPVLDIFFENLLLNFTYENIELWFNKKKGIFFLYRLIEVDGCEPAPLLECILESPRRKRIFCDYLKNCEFNRRAMLMNEIHQQIFPENGSNVVHFAAIYNCEALIELFIQHNLELTNFNHYGESPLYIAISLGHTKIYNLLRPVHKLFIPILDNAPYLDTGLTLPFYSALDFTSKEISKGLKTYQQNDALAKWEPTSHLKNSTPLLSAIWDDDLEAVFNYLEQETYDVNAIAGENNTTPLLIAIQKGNANMVNILLEYGANPNQALKNGATPLIIAAQHGFESICRQLLSKGALETLCTNDGYSPLLIAVNFGHHHVAQFLFDVNSLMMFCEFKYEGKKTRLLMGDIVRRYPWLEERMNEEELRLIHSCILFNLFSDIEAGGVSNLNSFLADKMKMDFLMTKSPDFPEGLFVLILKNPEYVRIFCDFLQNDIIKNGIDVSVLKKMERDVRSYNGFNMVYIAALCNSDLFINLFEKYNINLNDAPLYELRPIFYAIKNGNMAAVVAFISAGAAYVDHFYSPLHFAIEHKQSDIIELLGAYASSNILNSSHNGNTPLTLVMKYDDDSLVDDLIRSNSEIDINLPRDQDGCTPLHLAIIKENVHIMNLLLAHPEIDVNYARAGDGVTPLDLALNSGNVQIIKALIDAGANNSKVALNKAITAFNRSQVTMLGNDVNRSLFFSSRSHVHDMPAVDVSIDMNRLN